MKRQQEFENYLLSKMTSETTVKMYVAAVKNFIDLIGDKSIEMITEDDLTKYKLWCIQTKKYQRNTLGTNYGYLNNYLRMGHSKLHLKSPKPEVKNVIAYTRDEILAMFDVVRYDPRLTAILKTMYFTWIRRFEICNLNTADVDWEHQKLRINDGKGNRYDVINIHSDALTAIKEWLEHRHPKKHNETALFLNEWGNRINNYNVHTLIKQVSVKAKISKRSYPHLMRITGITHSAERGVSVSEIAKQSRHKNIQCLLERYIRPNEQHVKTEYLRGISLDEPEPVQQQPPVQHLQQQSQIQKSVQQLQQPQVIQSEQAQLLKMLLNNEVTSEAFTLAMNTINERKENKISGYQ